VKWLGKKYEFGVMVQKISLDIVIQNNKTNCQLFSSKNQNKSGFSDSPRNNATATLE